MYFRFRIKVRGSFLGGSFRVRISIGGRGSFFISFRIRGGVRVRFWLGPGTRLEPKYVSPLCFQFLANSLVPFVAVFYL